MQLNQHVYSENKSNNPYYSISTVKLLLRWVNYIWEEEDNVGGGKDAGLIEDLEVEGAFGVERFEIDDVRHVEHWESHVDDDLIDWVVTPAYYNYDQYESSRCEIEVVQCYYEIVRFYSIV